MERFKVAVCVLVFLLVPVLGHSSPGATIKCEVMDSGRVNKSLKGDWGDLHYIVFHHAHSEDRPRLSEYLKSFSGSEIGFTFHGKSCRAVLFRLPQCFGRGLLLYKKEIGLEKNDIIEVEFK